jgi:hypothetical protein
MFSISLPTLGMADHPPGPRGILPQKPIFKVTKCFGPLNLSL